MKLYVATNEAMITLLKGNITRFTNNDLFRITTGSASQSLSLQYNATGAVI